MALFGAWAFNFSPTFYYYTINPMPDNLALCFGIWGLTVFFIWIKEQRWKWLLTSGLLLSLSTLCKLPFILYFSVPFFYLFLNLKPLNFKSSNLKSSNLISLNLKSLSILLFLVPPIVWYLNVIPGWHGNGIVQGILDNKASSDVLLGHFFHHLFITLPDLLLNYGSVPLLLAGFYFLFKNKKFKSADFKYFAILGLLLILYFLFELNMIGKSHDYYFFPFLPLLFMLVAYGAYSLYISKVRFVREFVLALMLVLPFAAFLRIDSRWNPEKPGFNKDLLVFKDELRQIVPDNALCIAGNDISHFIFFYYIDKKGWNFDHDGLDENKMEEMISGGAEYLYTDSRKVEENTGISKYFDKTVLEKGSIKVIKLKDKNQGFQP
jgi:4-amino-4-deoxy-L-arabinose transferase-like glycosyltransferase